MLDSAVINNHKVRKIHENKKEAKSIFIRCYTVRVKIFSLHVSIPAQISPKLGASDKLSYTTTINEPLQILVLKMKKYVYISRKTRRLIKAKKLPNRILLFNLRLIKCKTWYELDFKKIKHTKIFKLLDILKTRVIVLITVYLARGKVSTVIKKARDRERSARSLKFARNTTSNRGNLYYYRTLCVSTTGSSRWLKLHGSQVMGSKLTKDSTHHNPLKGTAMVRQRALLITVITLIMVISTRAVFAVIPYLLLQADYISRPDLSLRSRLYKVHEEAMSYTKESSH